MSPVAAKAAPQSTAGKMSLGSLVKGRQLENPFRITLYAGEGLGKSTFAAGAPSPIFIATEDGTAHLDVARFPRPESWEDVLEAVQTLTDDKHEFRSLVVDTLDHAEPLVWKHVCEQNNVKGIEDVGGGYGKGYQAALDVWRGFLRSLEVLQSKTRMNVILLAHAQIKTFKSPDTADFDRYSMKLNDKAAGLIKEWSDAVFFANYETVAKEDKKTKRVRGIDTGARLIYTQRRAAYDAKTRYALPESLPLSWVEFEAAVRANRPADPEVLVAEIRRKASALGPSFEKSAEDAIKRAAGDASKLAILNDLVNAKTMEMASND
jgi:hypothetical protein